MSLPIRDLGSLPTNITTQRINSAVLPVKIEAARTAISKCTDLAELLAYKDQAEGLAAAVRTMKHIGPEMIRQANEMMADAWRKGGELLRQYSSAAKVSLKHKDGKIAGTTREISPRYKIARDLGLNDKETLNLVRVAAAPKETVYAATHKSQSLEKVSNSLPRINTHGQYRTYGEAIKNILQGRATSGGNNGLLASLAAIKRIDLDNFKRLTTDERKTVKAKITEFLEVLDEMDRLCR
jgi:hypothetical protein